MPTVIPTSTNYDLAWDLVKLLVSDCIQAVPGDNFVDGYNGDTGAIANKFHLWPDFFQDEPDQAGVVMAAQDEMEATNPVRRASVTVMLRAPDDSAGSFSGRQWASQAVEAVASYIRQSTGEYRTLVNLASGRKILSFHAARILPIGEDNAKRWVSSILFDITYTEHELSSGG